MMRKKLIIFISIVLCYPFVVRSDSWHHYQAFAGVDQLAQTQSRVYFVSGGSLFAYDKRQDETLVLSTQNDLNDSDVTGVYASVGSTNAIVTYSSGNIDILTDKGKVINMPDIKDSRMSVKNINSVAFSDDDKEMLVGTAFGVVKYNLERHEVKESCIFNVNVTSVGYIDNMAVIATGNTLYWCGSGSRFSDILTWESVEGYSVVSMTYNSGLLFGVLWHQGLTVPVLFNYDSVSDKIVYRVLSQTSVKETSPGNNGAPFFAATSDYMMWFDNNGNLIKTASLTDELSDTPFTAASGAGSVWFGLSRGIQQVDMMSTPLKLSETITVGELSVHQIHLMNFGKSGKLYMSNRGNSNVFGTSGTIVGHQSIMNEDGDFVDITPMGLSEPYNTTGRNENGYLMAPTFIKESGRDSGTYYSGNIMGGFYGLSSDDGHEIVHYSDRNSTLTDYWGVRVQDIAFDPRGFMWVLSERTPGLPSLMCLSPEGIAKGTAVSKNDWYEAKITSDFYASRDGKLLVSKNGRYVYIKGENDIFVYDTKGTADFSDDTGYQIKNFRLYDGSGTFSPLRFNAMLEDPSTGAIWVATTDGVFYISNPFNVTNQSVDIVRPKVPRNDGTDLADYLLSTQWVYSMACDPAGHKWMTTRESGVYLVSGDGTEILKNFTKDNSDLDSNCVFSVACDPAGSDKVYFGTENGLMVYRSDYSAGKNDFSNVKIYPNPLRPDYYGDVVIEGLMDGSKVKIVSSAGTLIAELQSEGGTLRWNARSGGTRIPSGVYYVMASSEDGDAGAVGKIVVVR